jgi:hypothetical protein
MRVEFTIDEVVMAVVVDFQRTVELGIVMHDLASQKIIIWTRLRHSDSIGESRIYYPFDEPLDRRLI